MLKVELKDKQATINNLLDFIKNLTVNENKLDGSHELQAVKVCSKDNDDDGIVRELLQIDQFHHRLQKLKDQPHNSAETPNISLGVNQDCYQRSQNESVLNKNVYLSSSNANNKDITNEKNMYAGKVVHNEPGDSLIVSHQGSNKIFIIAAIVQYFLETVFPKA